MNADDYCELCDLPKSQCVHGQPPPAPKPAAAPAPARRTRAAPAARTRTRTTAAPAKKPVTLRWTPPEAFKPLILAVLEDSGGELAADDVFSELETLVADRLKPADSERTPEGELRWHYAVRRARVALIGDGLMTKSRPGVWELA